MCNDLHQSDVVVVVIGSSIKVWDKQANQLWWCAAVAFNYPKIATTFGLHYVKRRNMGMVEHIIIPRLDLHGPLSVRVLVCTIIKKNSDLVCARSSPKWKAISGGITVVKLFESQNLIESAFRCVLLFFVRDRPCVCVNPKMEPTHYTTPFLLFAWAWQRRSRLRAGRSRCIW